MLDQENIIYLKIWVLSYILLDDLWVKYRGKLHVNHLREELRVNLPYAMCYPPICNKLIRFLVWYLCDGGIGNNQ